MKTLLREIDWGVEMPMFFSHGYANGYVLIPKGHPWHKVHYDDIPVDVHGGLTFSEEVDGSMVDDFDELTKEDVGKWMIGFDTCHSGDNMSNWSEQACQEEVERLAKQCDNATSEDIFPQDENVFLQEEENT
jgi:hypothetical protein